MVWNNALTVLEKNSQSHDDDDENGDARSAFDPTPATNDEKHTNNNSNSERRIREMEFHSDAAVLLFRFLIWRSKRLHCLCWMHSLTVTNDQPLLLLIIAYLLHSTVRNRYTRKWSRNPEVEEEPAGQYSFV
jgi:hypothetical protein